jgi:L,D-transpeptidase YcbB
MTCSVTLRHNASEAEQASIGKSLASGQLKRNTRRKAERRMRAFGPRNRRRLRLPQRAGPVTVALAASLALAQAQPAAGPSPGDGAAKSILSPEAPPSFGEIPGASPLLIVLNVATGVQISAPDMRWITEPKFDLASQGAPREGADAPFAAAPEEQAAARESPPPVAYDPTAGPALSPMQSALHEAMDRLIAGNDATNPLGGGDWRAARGAIAAFYAARSYAPVWVGEEGLTRAGRAAVSQLERARDDGLDLMSFAPPHEIEPARDPEALAEAEAAIASAVVVYAEQASGSRVPPSHVSPLIFAAPSLVDPGVALAETAAAADPARRLADFNPPQSGYRALREALNRLDAPLVSAEGRGPKRPAVPRIHTASTSAAFVFNPLARERTAILANMEMWRWEPRDMGERRIEVNVADFSVAALEGDAVILQTRAIVGKPETPTPVFSSVMRYVLVNPSWQVPDSIIKKEMMSKLGALSRRGYEVKTVGGRLTVRQLPGDDNALGRIAFVLPNDHAIYLHDTPARELFDEEARAFSHGCVRVEDPVSLAELVLDGETSGWTAARIEGAIGGKERTVFLPRPLPIHIEYFTEFVDQSGELQERPDVYGITRRVERILGRASQG